APTYIFTLSLHDALPIYICEVGQLFARRKVLARHLVIVLRGSPHSSHRRGRRPCLIHLGRAVLVDVLFKVLQLDTQKCSPLDKALHQSEFIVGHRRQNLPKPLLLRFDSRISCHLLLSSHISTAYLGPKTRGVTHARPSSKLEGARLRSQRQTVQPEHRGAMEPALQTVAKS